MMKPKIDALNSW